tara:strand:+ start:1150 stop:1704 length:555 start_codon:yes stop_codon:yes gene_type:complete
MKFETICGPLLIIVAITLGVIPVAAASDGLPLRSGPAPITTKNVPHVQIGVEAVPEVSAELLRLVDDIPGVEIRDTVVSLPGALGFWLNEDISLARPDVIVRGREFAHLHPDGSLHASLSPELAARAIETGWAISHTWAKTMPGWEDFVMIYTPRSMAEMKTVFQLVLGSYKFVTGKGPADSEG